MSLESREADRNSLKKALSVMVVGTAVTILAVVSDRYRGDVGEVDKHLMETRL